jgi:AcrR family transcriptional regulator
MASSDGTCRYDSGMPIPVTPSPGSDSAAPQRPEWPALTPEAKRERIIEAAIRIFSESGLEAPMHDVAVAAGAGVASIYRVFPSKHDLWAAIVVRRMDEIVVDVRKFEAGPGDRWSALVGLLRERVRKQSPEPFTTEARAATEGREDVDAAIARAGAAQERLLAAARAEGRLRADATVEDLRLLFAATRAARRLNTDGSRMFELMLDALDTRRGESDG